MRTLGRLSGGLITGSIHPDGGYDTRETFPAAEASEHQLDKDCFGNLLSSDLRSLLHPDKVVHF